MQVRGGKRAPGGGGGIGMTPGRTPTYGGVGASPHPYRSGGGNVLASPARQSGAPQMMQSGMGMPGGGRGAGMYSGRVTTQQVGGWP